MGSVEFEILITIAEQDLDTIALDLHGQRPENAEQEVDFFLDQSAHAGIQVVKIIYGVGTGALADSIPNFVKNHSSVEYARGALVSNEAGTVIYAALR